MGLLLEQRAGDFPRLPREASVFFLSLFSFQRANIFSASGVIRRETKFSDYLFGGESIWLAEYLVTR